MPGDAGTMAGPGCLASWTDRYRRLALRCAQREIVFRPGVANKAAARMTDPATDHTSGSPPARIRHRHRFSRGHSAATPSLIDRTPCGCFPCSPASPTCHAAQLNELVSPAAHDRGGPIQCRADRYVGQHAKPADSMSYFANMSNIILALQTAFVYPTRLPFSYPISSDTASSEKVRIGEIEMETRVLSRNRLACYSTRSKCDVSANTAT